MDTPLSPSSVKTKPAAAPPVEAAAEDRWQHAPGDVVDGKYRLVRPLGRGGMAEVWLAVHENLKTELALKFLDAELQRQPDRSRTALERFRFEAQISARLGARTRHIVAVHDAGVHGQTPYLAMEYVPGRTLNAELDEKGTLDPPRLADMLDQLADALGVAHEMGIVHRDLKPSNVMIAGGPGEAPFVKVADFGIAKALRDDLDVDRPKDTALGFLLGSPSYMSPEQLHAAGGIDRRSDIWALGVLAYEALTGWPPFDGRTVAELIVAVSSRQFQPPSRHRPELPRALDRWFTRALAKDPHDRFPSVDAMARAFRDALAEPPRAGAAAYARLAGAALLALAAAGLLGVAAWRALEPPEHVMMAQRLPATRRPSLPEVAPTVAPEPPAPASASARAPATAPATARAPATAPARAPTTAPAPAPAPPAEPAPPPHKPRREVDPSEIQ